MTMTETKPKLITADELLRLYSEGVRGELIRGRLCETMSTGVEHGEIVMNLGGELRNFVKPRRLGRIMGSDAGVWLERGPDTVREPDIGFLSAAKAPLGTRITGFSHVIPDLVVEVVSPSDTPREVNDKARMWISYGVPLVWAVYPDSRSVDVHTPGGATRTLGEGDELDGGDVLPGFRCGVGDIFES